MSDNEQKKETSAGQKIVLEELFSQAEDIMNYDDF